MLDDTSTTSLVVIIALSAALIIATVFTVFAVSDRDKALLELDEATRALHDVMRSVSVKEQLIAEELSRIERELGMPSTIPEFKTQSF